MKISKIQNEANAFKTIQSKDAIIEQQAKQFDQLDRKANPQHYQLSSVAELVYRFVPNSMSSHMHICTRWMALNTMSASTIFLMN